MSNGLEILVKFLSGRSWGGQPPTNPIKDVAGGKFFERKRFGCAAQRSSKMESFRTRGTASTILTSS